MPMFTLQNDNQFVIQRGGVKFVVVETRGDTAVAYATREPLPYAVFCQERRLPGSIPACSPRPSWTTRKPPADPMQKARPGADNTESGHYPTRTFTTKGHHESNTVRCDSRSPHPP